MFAIDDYKTDVQFKSLLSRLTALYKKDKDAFSGVPIPSADTSTHKPHHEPDEQQSRSDALNSDEEDEVLAYEDMNDDDPPSYDDDYAIIAAAASDLDGTVADLKVGDYVSFANGSLTTWLPGVIDEINPDHCRVKAMKKSTGNSFQWPTNGDSKTYDVEVKDLLCILQVPVFKRRYWSFTEKDVLDSQEAYMEWQKY